MLSPGKIGETLQELFRSVAGKADGELAFFVFSIDVNDGARAVSRVANALPIRGLASPLRGRAAGVVVRGEREVRSLDFAGGV